MSYRIRNWSKYNAGLKHRGSLTFWLDSEVIEQWDESTGEILSAVVTTNNVHDSEVFEDLLEVGETELEQVSGDGAYDQRHCYDSLRADNIKIRQQGPDNGIKSWWMP